MLNGSKLWSKVIAIFVVVIFLVSQISPILAATFTSSVAKRNAPGPYTSGILNQGGYPMGGGNPGDAISTSRGTQISGNFYTAGDNSQGSLVLWVTPEWNISDLGNNNPRFATTAGMEFGVVGTNSRLFLYDGTTTHNFDNAAAGWVAGNTYSVIFRWDTKNTLNGTHHYSVSVNDTPYFAGTSAAGRLPQVNSTFGGAGIRNLNALIEGLTLYRRPLFDGTYGIDVGNGDEVTQIYNSGTGRDPTLVTGSWDVILAIPTNSSTGSLTTGIGNAWTHPHSSNLLYTDTTNTGGYFMNGTYTNDGWNNFTDGWYNEDWLFRKQITIDADQVTGNSDLTDFPVLISLSSDDGLATAAQTDGDDILFALQDGTKLSHEIETFDETTGKLVAWVNMPVLDYDDDTSIYMYYGNSDASNQQSVETTWNEDFGMVQHFAETSGSHLDSTSNNNDSDSISVTAQGTAEGKIGGTDDLTGSSDLITIPDNVNGSLDHNEYLTISMWVKPTNLNSTYQAIFYKGSPTGDPRAYSFFITNTNEKIIMNWFDGGWIDFGADMPLVENDWHLITYKRASTVESIYFNGQQYWSAPTVKAINNNDEKIYIGYEASNIFYGSIDEFRIAGTDLSDEWIATEYNNQNSPNSFHTLGNEEEYTTSTTVSTLATSEKIFAGGYKATSTTSNQGIYYDKTVTAGDDWVVRAITNSDGTCTPKVVLYDQTNGAEIGSLTGTTTSTRTDPDVLTFTGEAPSGMTTLRTKLINTASSGTCYWHQVEVLNNLVSNPSFSSGSGDPWIPTGWNNIQLDSGESLQEDTISHSGNSALHLTTSEDNEGITQNLTGTNNKYYMTGIWGNLPSWTCTWFVDDLAYQFTLNSATIRYFDGDSWIHYKTVGRKMGIAQFNFNNFCHTNGNAYTDDAYVFELSDISLNISAASQANSTENTDEIRVDGRDTYIASSSEANSITTTMGFTSFNYRPRHSAADTVKFSETTAQDAYITTLYGDSDDFVKIYWDSANTLKMDYSMNGTTASGTWNATGAISANTEYSISLSYSGGGNMVLSIDDTSRITLSDIPDVFGTAPNTIYFGSDNNGANQGDATFSVLTFDNEAPTINLTALSPDPIADSTPTLSGSVSDSAGTISSVEYQLNGTDGAWENCVAGDGAFNEADETFTCSLPEQLDGEYTIYVRSTDTNGNTTNNEDAETDTFTIDTASSDIFNIDVTANASGAVITWETDEEASSIVEYDITTDFGNSTTETNTSPRVTQHEVMLTDLVSCSTYHFRIKSIDSALNEAVSPDNSIFSTRGCTSNSSTVDKNSGKILSGSGGSISLLDISDLGIELEVPENYASADAVFQIVKLDSSTVINDISTPEDYELVGDYIYELQALEDVNTTITEFDEPIDIIITYSDEDFEELDETMMAIFRWDGNEWIELEDCIAGAHTFTCPTEHFSTFGFFAPPIIEEEPETPEDSEEQGSGSQSRTFLDLDQSPLKEYVLSLYNSGIVDGYSDGTFKPENYVTRAELAKFVVNGFDLTATIETSKFPDVPDIHVQYDYIYTLKQLDIISGYPDGTFRPNKYVTRAETSKIITKGLQAKGVAVVYNDQNKFGDVDNNHTLYNYISFLADKKIVNGYSDGTFKPDVFLTRSQMAKIVWNSTNLK